MDKPIRKCPVCNQDLPENTNVCPNCGTLITEEINPLVTDVWTEEDGKRSSADNERKEKWKQLAKNPLLIGAAVLILALAAVNVLQFVNARKNVAQISSLKQETADLKQEAAGLRQETDILKSENETLQQSIESLEEKVAEAESSTEDKNSEIVSLKSEKAQLEKDITDLDSKIASLEKDKADWQSKYETLSSGSKNAISAYDTIKSFQYGTKSSDYYTNTEAVIVKVGEKKTINITCTIPNSTVSFKGSTGAGEGAWGKDWNNNTCTWSVTGKQEGTSVYTFTNAANSHSFQVLVIVVPK